MDKLVFMSSAHVKAMNERFAAMPEVRAACARLPRDVRIAQHLHDEDGGADVWWQIIYSRSEGCSLALGPPQAPVDAIYKGGYWAMLCQTEAMILGSAQAEKTADPAPNPPHVSPEFAEAMALTAEVYALCWAEGLKMDIKFPQRGRDSPVR